MKKRKLLQTDIISLHEWGIRYLDFSSEKYVRKTYNEKRFAFQELFKCIESKMFVSDLHKGDVLKHFSKQYKKRGGNAVNNDRKNLVAGWNWGLKYIENFPIENPFMVDRFPEIRHPRYIPPVEDFYKVYDIAETKQDQLLLMCFLHLAARKNEIYKLKWDAISFTDKKVRLLTRKRRDGTGEYDWLPLTNFLFDGLTVHRMSRVSEWVFPNPKTKEAYGERLRWMNRLCDKAGVKRFGLHAIRHLSASILIENDTALIDIKTILRHKSISTTERYLHRLKSVRASLDVFDEKALQASLTNKKTT
ncbi:MAG: tyrosine-type recombinase/integrase [Desulfotalea sp.]